MSTQLWTPPLDGMTLAVEIAFGADLTDSDGSGWTWTDVTADVRQNPGISTKLGRGDEASRSQPATCTLTLDNSAASYSLGGHSPNYPYVRRGVPVRVRIDPDDGSGYAVVFLGFAVGWTPDWQDGVGGTIPVVQLSASGTLQRLTQGDSPLDSAYRRSITDTATVVAYWPMEEQRGAQISPAVRGGQPMQPSDPLAVNWASSDVFESSAPLPDVGASGLLAAVSPYTQTLENQVRFFVRVPDNGLADGTVLAYVYTTGTLYRWDIVYADAGTGNLSLFIYNQDGTLNTSTTNVTFDMDGNRRRLGLSLTQNGSNVDWRLEVLDANPGDPGGGFSGTVNSKTAGIVSQVYLTPGGGASGTIMGHLTVQNDILSNFEAASAFWAWQRRDGSLTSPEVPSSGTASASRIARLMTENGLELDRHTGALVSDTINASREGMGPQLPKPLLELLQDCEVVDQGQLWDGRTPGLSFTTRRYREDGVVALSLDAAAGQLAAPFDPVDDDQRTRNRVTASRTYGASATYEDTTGPMGSSVIGTYDTAVEINGSNDLMMIQHASWQVSLGTVPGYRYPTVAVDLRATPELAADVLALIPGDRVQVINPEAVLGGFRPGTVDLIVEGIAHEISAAGWIATLTCSWASPWIVGRVAAESGDTSEYLLRADTDGSTLAVSAPRNATTLSVATASGPLWTTAADNYPLTLDVGGVPVVASACSGSSSPQTFTVAALELDRLAGSAVKLYDPRPLGL